MVADKSAIQITADNVTLDLMGFSVLGTPGNPAALASASENVTVRNGSIRSRFGMGLSLTGSGAVVEHMRVSNCGGGGIGVGVRSRVAWCIANNNTQAGIAAGNASAVADCQAYGNGRGIDVGSTSLVKGCVANGNIDWGFRETTSGWNTTFIDCVSTNKCQLRPEHGHPRSDRQRLPVLPQQLCGGPSDCQLRSQRRIADADGQRLLMR
jgi:hypothetical protein